MLVGRQAGGHSFQLLKPIRRKAVVESTLLDLAPGSCGQNVRWSSKSTAISHHLLVTNLNAKMDVIIRGNWAFCNIAYL